MLGVVIGLMLSCGLMVVASYAGLLITHLACLSGCVDSDCSVGVGVTDCLSFDCYEPASRITASPLDFDVCALSSAFGVSGHPDFRSLCSFCLVFRDAGV